MLIAWQSSWLMCCAMWALTRKQLLPFESDSLARRSTAWRSRDSGNRSSRSASAFAVDRLFASFRLCFLISRYPYAGNLSRRLLPTRQPAARLNLLSPRHPCMIPMWILVCFWWRDSRYLFDAVSICFPSRDSTSRLYSSALIRFTTKFQHFLPYCVNVLFYREGQS